VDGHAQANVADETAARAVSDLTILSGYDDGHVRTAPVGLFPPNAFGLRDMAGNVSEWCADWYEENQYASADAGRDPHGPAVGANRVLRGGAWNDQADPLRLSYRMSDAAATHVATVGFRCARDLAR
jgi:formylglycine-generating enzyme required for sulfatase activity